MCKQHSKPHVCRSAYVGVSGDLISRDYEWNTVSSLDSLVTYSHHDKSKIRNFWSTHVNINALGDPSSFIIISYLQSVLNL